jgi:hypothetical protein
MRRARRTSPSFRLCDSPRRWSPGGLRGCLWRVAELAGSVAVTRPVQQGNEQVGVEPRGGILIGCCVAGSLRPVAVSRALSAKRSLDPPNRHGPAQCCGYSGCKEYVLASGPRYRWSQRRGAEFRGVFITGRVSTICRRKQGCKPYSGGIGDQLMEQRPTYRAGFALDITLGHEIQAHRQAIPSDGSALVYRPLCACHLVCLVSPCRPA